MTTLEGYDISAHQAATPDLTGIDFVICRAAYGATPDRLYAMHSANAKAQGKVVGAYIFARPITTGDTVEEQFDALMTAAPDADFWAIDREKDGDSGIITLADTRKLIGLIHATGRRVGLYSSESLFRELGQDWNWVAHWGAEPVISYDIWQWEGGGADRLDNDRFRGTRGALLALGAPLEDWVTAQIAARDEQIAALSKMNDRLESDLASVTVQLEATETALAQANLAVAELDTDARAAASSITYLRVFSSKYGS